MLNYILETYKNVRRGFFFYNTSIKSWAFNIWNLVQFLWVFFKNQICRALVICIDLSAKLPIQFD